MHAWEDVRASGLTDSTQVMTKAKARAERPFYRTVHYNSFLCRSHGSRLARACATRRARARAVTLCIC